MTPTLLVRTSSGWWGSTTLTALCEARWRTFVGARLGRRHCSLCDITHGAIRQRPEWKTCQAGLQVPFDTYHRNDQPESVRNAANNQAPVVVAETGNGKVVLLAPADLELCEGSIDRLIAAIEQAADRLGLAWTTRGHDERGST